jgi:group I intron endonuclease
MKNSGIYQIKNVVNGKRYVGSAINITRRLRRHVLDLQKNRHCNVLLQNAWNKYREEKFKLETIENCGRSILIDREQYYFNALKPEYNIYSTAGSPLNYVVSDETRCKIACSHLGLLHSAETKRKMSASHKGKSFSKEHSQKISKNAKERFKNKKNHPMFGKKHSEESKRKMSESLKRLYKQGD